MKTTIKVLIGTMAIFTALLTLNTAGPVAGGLSAMEC
jgi:hypothetical protein